MRRELAQQALVAAGRVRASAGKDATAALCVYDLVLDRQNLELRFQPLASLEGMYSPSDSAAPLIIVSSLRPSARRRYTCAHELGHHVFGHGTRVDELFAEQRSGAFSPEEFLAECFAGFLLMPKLAVMRAFTVRGLKPAAATAIEVYRIACYFGVGYSTLVQHMNMNLRLISAAKEKELLRISPKQLRLDVLGEDSQTELLLVDTSWTGRAVDVARGDLVLVPRSVRVEGERLQFLRHHEGEDLYEALSPGIGRLEHEETGWSAYVRVERRDYGGRGIYRHEEECDE